jgi:predicted dehydrogenase
MSSKIRLALVGGGLITESAHLPAALACPDAELAALVDPVLDRIDGLARRFGIAPRLARDVTEVLDRVDAAVIATPNDSHAPIALACISAGVPVLIEKPLAASLSDGRAIAEAARDKGVLVAPGYVTRFRPNLRMLKSLLDAGYFGRIRRFVHQFGTPGGWAPLSGYNLARASTGGGVLMVTGTHFIDRLLWFWGMPAAVSYWDDSRGGPEANCVARFRFEAGEGFEGEVRYSKTVALPGALVIEADRGTVIVADTDDAEIVFRVRDEADLVHVLREANSGGRTDQSPFDRQMCAFIAACRARDASAFSVEQAVDSLQLIERLYGCRQALVDEWYGEVQ